MIKETNGVRVEMTFEDKKMFVDNFDMSEIYEQLPNYEFFDRYMKEEKKLERYIVVMMRTVSIKDMNMSLIKSGSNILLVKKIQ